MRTSSPLRYPGGKSAMASLLQGIRQLNGLGGNPLAEPFAGGAGASLTLLFKEEAPRIFINDFDSAIYDFWWTIVNRSGPFLEMLSRKRVSIAEWRRQRAVYLSKGRVSRLRRGFAAFYLNRCNRSGVIMNGGPIGGFSQDGEWKINARFNKEELRQRCEKIAEYRQRIDVFCQDGIEFIKAVRARRPMYFVDPPYFEKGKTLYLNALNEQYHATLAAQLKSMEQEPWVLTYDDCPEIRELYQGWADVRPFSLRYAANQRRAGKEILITPKWIILPETQKSAAIGW